MIYFAGVCNDGEISRKEFVVKHNKLKLFVKLNLLFIISVFIFLTGEIKAYAQQPAVDWQRAYTIPEGANLEDCAVSQAEDGDYIIVGTRTNAVAYSGYVFFMRVDEDGDIEDYYEINVPYRYARSIDKCQDGSFVIAGSQFYPRGGSNYDCDLWVCKISYSVDPHTGKHFLEESNISDKIFNDDENWGSWGGYEIQETVNSLGGPDGYIIAGNRYEKPRSNNKEYIYLLKLEEDFDIEWSNNTYLSGSYGDFGMSVRQTDDQGYILAGWRYNNATYEYSNYILKTDDEGVKKWDKVFEAISPSGQDYVWSIREADDDSFIISGQASVDSTTSGFTMKLSTTGNIVWTHTYPILSSGSSYIGRNVALETQDGGTIIAGLEYEGNPYYLTYAKLFKTSPSGSEEWQYRILIFDDDKNTDYITRDMIETQDGSYIILGTYSRGHAYADPDNPKGLFLFKLAPDKVDVDIKAAALYKKNEEEHKLDIKATADCSEDGELNDDNTVSASYELIDESEEPVGISGDLVWNEDTDNWEAMDIDIGSVIDEVRKVSITFEDENNHKGTKVIQISADAKLGLSSYTIMENGNVYIYATLTDIIGERDTSGNAELTVKLAGEKEEYILFDTGGDGDLGSNDGHYGTWLNIPGSTPRIVELYLGEEMVDSEIINVTTSPELAVITNIHALYAEFLDTGTADDEDEDDNKVMDFYDLLECIAQYAKNNNGVVYNLYQEVLAEKGYYNDYYSLVYGTDTSDMARNIDLLVYKMGVSRSLKNVAIIGDDEVVPFARRSDPIDWEKGYYNDMSGGGGNPTIVDSGDGFIMSDIPYGSYDCWHPDDEHMPRLDAGVGRVFADHPMDLINIIDGYQMPVLLNNAAIYQAEDDSEVSFVSLVEHTLLPILGNHYDFEIFGGTFDLGDCYHYGYYPPQEWNALDFTDALSNVGLNMLWTHADHGSAHTYKNSSITANNTIKIMKDSPGHILLTPACHSGYSLSHNSPDGNFGYYDNAMVKEFLKKQVSYFASTTYGCVVNDFVAYHERIFQKYLENLLNPSNATVGDVLVKANSDFWKSVDRYNIDPTDTYAAYGVCYYGLPTQPIQHNSVFKMTRSRDVGVMSEKDLEDQDTVPVKLSIEMDPVFNIEEEDGKKLFKVEGQKDLYIHAFAPVMPIIIESYELPRDAMVEEVNLIDFDTTEYFEEVELPEAVPISISTNPALTLEDTFEMPDLYPENMYWWSTEEDGNNTILNLSVVPMQYNHEERQAILFNHLEFEVVRSHAALTIDTTSLPAGNERESYNVDLKASGGVEPYTWNTEGLPEGLSVRTNGAITGIPTTFGTSEVRVTVYDSEGTEASKTFSLTINQKTQESLTIDTQSLPSGKVGRAYSVNLAASGGIEPYVWSADLLPEGLAIRTVGAISGTPEQSGSSEVTITVTDNDGTSENKIFNLIISKKSSSSRRNTSVVTERPSVTQKRIKLMISSRQADIDGEAFMIDAEPFIDVESGRTLVPLRFIGEALGAEVSWNQETMQVTIKDGIKEIILTIGSKDVLVDGEIITIDCVPLLMPPGRTFVPLRFISETLGAEVEYNHETKEIEIIKRALN